MKVEIVEITVFSADDGKKFDSAEELAIYQFGCHIEERMKKENCGPEDAIEFITYNWEILEIVRKEIINKIQHAACRTAENHKNLQGVL